MSLKRSFLFMFHHCAVPENIDTHRRDWNFLGCRRFCETKLFKTCMKLNRNFHSGGEELEKLTYHLRSSSMPPFNLSGHNFHFLVNFRGVNIVQ